MDMLLWTQLLICVSIMIKKIKTCEMKKYLLTYVVIVSFLLQSCNNGTNQIKPRAKKQEANERIAKNKLGTISLRKHEDTPSSDSSKFNKRSVEKRKREKEKKKTGPQLKVRRMEVVSERDENTTPQNIKQKVSCSGKKKHKTKRRNRRRNRRNNSVLKPTFTKNGKTIKTNGLETKLVAKKVELFDIFEKEDIMKRVVSRLPLPDRLHLRLINRELHNLFSGYDQVGLRGVINRPVRTTDVYASIYEYTIEFPKTSKEKEERQPEETMPSTLDTIPSFIFYQLMKWVKKLPKEFWPYIEHTKIEKLYLNWIGITDGEAEQLGGYLQRSKVIGINLQCNQITYVGALRFGQKLLETNVRQVVLKNNSIESQEEQSDIRKKCPGIKWIF